MNYEQAIIIKRQGYKGDIGYILDVLNERGIRYFETTQSLPYGKMPGNKDALTLVISLGGDGTMLLSMIASLQYKHAYVTGVNFGNLGFLTDDLGKNSQGINDIIDGVDLYDVEKNIISVKTQEGKELDVKGANDVVLSTAASSPPMIFTAKVDGRMVFSFRGTGVMLSTPTGSTAMSMSNGGPVLAPGVDALIVSPILPHGLALRPVIVPRQSEVVFSVKQPTYGLKNLYAVADGRDSRTFKLEQGEQIEFNLNAYQKVMVLEAIERDFFQLLSHKLGWGSGPRL